MRQDEPRIGAKNDPVEGAMQIGAAGVLHGMQLAGTEQKSRIEGGIKMELSKNVVPGLSQTSVSGMNGADGRSPIRLIPPGPTVRMRTIDCLLADIQAQIQILRRERTHLGLVRTELAGMEAKRRSA